MSRARRRGFRRRQAEQVNALLAEALRVAESESAEVVLPARILQGISERSPLGSVAPLPPLPATPLSQNDLLVKAEGGPNVGTELRREIASADSVNLICAFVIWSGVRQLRDALAELVERDGMLRQCAVAGRLIDWNELSTGGRSLLVLCGRLRLVIDALATRREEALVESWARGRCTYTDHGPLPVRWRDL